MNLRASLRAFAEASPAGSVVPVTREVLLEVLDGEASRVPDRVADPDLTVENLAIRFGRSRSTVRTWLEQRRFPGAYRLRGREWRVPAVALTAFEATERGRAPGSQAPGPLPTTRPTTRPKTAVDLGRWRRLGSE
jgi:hypothetical protein